MENHRKYTVVLEQESDGGFVATVPALRGCVSQGDTRAEVLGNIQEAIDLYIEDCEIAGDPVPEEHSVEFVELGHNSLTKLPADISGQELRQALRTSRFRRPAAKGSHMILR